MALDVIVIGAGAAGLACRADLLREGLSVLCVEARDRIGGRIHTIHDERSPVPIELGAEFVHGLPNEITELMRGRALQETAGRMLDVSGGRPEEAGEGGPVLDDLKRAGSRENDVSFQEFLNHSKYSEEDKADATGFIEGFNAACKEEVSVASLARDLLAADEIDGNRAFRVPEGYDAVISELAGPTRDLQLNCAVTSVKWRPGECSVQLRSGETLSAGRVVVTVPLGVLQANAITFHPALPEIAEAAQSLRTGQAIRVTLQFSRAFWEDSPAFADTGFLFSDEPVFPVWWSRLPARVPILTGWSAGPKADPLLRLSSDEVIARAVETLRRMLGPRARDVTASWFHDWHADPYALGAYSWVPAGALPARETLAQPVADTLYFAGEATDLLGYGGTVHGAIAAGRRAAAQILSTRTGA